MDKDLLSLLDANKVELEGMLQKYEYLNKTHNNLTKSIKKNVDATNNFYKKSGGVIEDIAVMTTSVKKDMIALNEAMSEQIALVKKVNEEMDDISNKYYISKDELAEVIQLLEKRAEIQERINNLGDPNLLTSEQVHEWNQLSAALIKVEKSMNKYGEAAKRIKNDFDGGDDKLKKLVKNTKQLKQTTDKVKNAQDDYNKSMDEAIQKADKFKKSGWFAILSSGLSILKNIGRAGIDKYTEVDQTTRDFGRQMGFTAKQLEKHTSGIYDSYGSMAAKLGMDFKEMYKFQVGYADATEKSVILTSEQVGTIAGLARTTGEEALSTASKNLDIFATSADSTIEYMAKGTARAALEGLNVKKYSDAFANNIKLASRFTFREGINGIQKMTLLSQRLKFNMESIGGVMEKFSTLEGALEVGAKLQVLGGPFAQNFGNPLEAMSEALLDGEAFTKRIIDTVSSSAKFDVKTGEIRLSPLDIQRLKAAASAMGMNYDDLHNMATQSRKSSIIESYVSDKKLSEEQISFLTNKAQYNKTTGKWHLTKVDGTIEEKDISQMTSKEIDAARSSDTYEKIIASNVQDIHKLVQSKVSGETSVLEDIKGFDERILMFLGGVLSSLGGIAVTLAVIKNSSLFGGPIGDLMGDMLGRGGRRGSRMLSRSGGIARSSRKPKVRIKRQPRKYGLGRNSFSNLTPNGRGIQSVGGTVGKWGGRLGSIAAVALGAYEAYDGYNNYSKNREEILNNNTMSKEEKAKALNDAKKERNASYGSAAGGTVGGIAGMAVGGIAGAKIGAAIGSFGGPIGTVAGLAIGGAIGWIGSVIGEKIGESVTEDVDETMKEVKDENIQDNINNSKHNESFYNGRMQEYVGKIWGGVSNISWSINHIDGIVSQIWNGQINPKSVVNSPNGKNQSMISISDMKINVGGEIKLVSDISSKGIEINKLLTNNEFKKGIIDIVNDAIKTQISGHRKEKTVS